MSTPKNDSPIKLSLHYEGDITWKEAKKVIKTHKLNLKNIKTPR